MGFRVQYPSAIAFRHSKNLEDRVTDRRGPESGHVFQGSDEGDGWIKSGQFYLPKFLSGKQVIMLEACLHFCGFASAEWSAKCTWQDTCEGCPQCAPTPAPIPA